MQLKIYISSTFIDLEQHREKVYRALRSLRHDVVAMEDYVAADERPLDRCLRDVRDADVYVGIFGWRYGYVPLKGNPTRRSITELEYLEAGRLGKPRLVFILDEKAPWAPNMMDTTTGDNDRGARILRLREEIQRDRLAGRFDSAEQLASRVVSALYVWQLEAAEAPAKSTGKPARRPPAPSAAPSGPARARSKGSLLWANGSKLRVRFLGGPELLQQRVLRLAQIWSAYANIAFEPSDALDAEVRVGFEPGGGSWAYEGTACLDVAHDQPTVNLDWLSVDSPISDLESVVLHEFGHVLGLAHEHANPDAGIKWNKAVVYEQMGGPPNNWDRASVDQTIFKTWSRDRFPIRKPFDPLSITAFPVPREWIKDGAEISRNTVISVGDREFVSRLYPYSAATAAKVETKIARARPKPRSRRTATPTRG